MRLATELTVVESGGYPDRPKESTAFSPDGGEIASRRASAEMFREKSRRFDDFRECDAGRNSETFEEVEQVLGGEIARGARGVRAAAEAAGGRVVSRDAALDSGIHVRERRAARVVEVQGQDAPGHAGLV